MTGLTAEKHDSFLVADRRRRGDRRVHRQGTDPGRAGRRPASPPAACAPPSRPAATPPGTRPARRSSWRTPTARRWCIPTAFCRWTGEALDKKTPAAALDGGPVNSRPCASCGCSATPRPRKVFTTVGPEQEYFLIDKQLLLRPARPDQLPAARSSAPSRPRARSWKTSTSARSPSACWPSWPRCERELFKLGVPVKTRHNEVAPGQYEIAPIFENANLATDHQHAGDGDAARRSPRSTAWSACCTRSPSPASTARASTTTGRWPPTTARTCSTRATRRTTTPSSWSSAAAVIRAVHKYAELLRVGVAGAGNDHRLGANEAPPAIISHLPGRAAHRHLRADREGRRQEHQAAAGCIEIGVSVLPKLPQGRRRPQPHQPVRLHRQQVRVPRRRAPARSIAGPNTVLNTIVAESLDYVATELEKAVKGGKDLNKAVQDLLPEHHQGEQAGHLQRRQLHRGVARGGREARPAEPARTRSTACR